MLQPHELILYFPDFLKGIIEIARIRAHQEEVRFDSEIASEIPTGIHADEKCFCQILLNLINNAIKNRPTGTT